MLDFGIAGKTAVVCASSKGLGYGCADALAAVGVNLVMNARTPETLAAAAARIRDAHGVEVKEVPADITTTEGRAAVLEAAGHVDILVNNAAVRPHEPFLDTSEADWQHVMDVDMNAAVWLARQVIPGMVENGWGRIISFSGMNAQHGYLGAAAVSVAKHGVWGLTKALAVEFGPKGITANIISPGTFPPDGTNIDTNKTFAALLAANPSGRLGTPDDIAGMITYLCSDTGGFVNGQLLQINGGVVMQF